MAHGVAQQIRIFICYRRKWCAGWVVLIYDRLSGAFGRDNVFRDTHNIPSGSDWRDSLREAVERCDVLVALLTPECVPDNGVQGSHPLLDDDDWVRFELATALERGIKILPVLIGGAAMPGPKVLPDDIDELRFRQGEVLSDRTADADLVRLTSALRDIADDIARIRSVVQHFDECWRRGQWAAAADELDSLLQRTDLDVSQATRIRKMKPTVDTLGQADRLLTSGSFAEAHTLLQRIDPRDAPPNFEVVLRIVEIGRRAETAEKARDFRLLGELENELTAALAPVSSDTLVLGEPRLRRALVRLRRVGELGQADEMYDAGRFDEASALYAEQDSNAARDKAERCATWLGFQALVGRCEWAEAKNELRKLRSKEDRDNVGFWRVFCNQASSFVPALEAMAAGHSVPAPDVRWDGSRSPYDVMGLAPMATKDEIEDRSYEMQARGPSREEREAWNALRLAPQRLEADFLLYHVAAPERARKLLDRICAAASGPAPRAALLEVLPDLASEDDTAGKATQLREVIAAALGEDAAVFHAMQGNLETALAQFTRLVEQEPHATQHLHHLGLAAAGRVRALRRAEDDVTDALEKLIVAFAAVFATDAFWHRWWIDRKAVYPCTHDEITEARGALQERWFDALRSLSDEYPFVDAAMQAEVNGAAAVARGGGMPVERLGGTKVVLGFEGVRLAGLEDDVVRWVSTFEDDCLAVQSWMRDVCMYFSELARPAALVAASLHDSALEALEGLQHDASTDVDIRKTNPGFAGFAEPRAVLRRMRADLIVTSHVEIARKAVSESPVDTDRTFKHWREAVAHARKSGALDGTLEAIRDVAVGRAIGLCAVQDFDARMEALDDAVEILTFVHQEQWDDADRTARSLLADVLCDRSVWLHNHYDDERIARFDAQKALSLDPDSPRPIAIFCAASAQYARALMIEGNQELAAEVLKEMHVQLEHGYSLYPGHPQLREWEETAKQLEVFLESPDDAVNLVLEKLPEADEKGDEQRYAKALLLQSQGDYEGATTILWELCQEDPSRTDRRARLAMCYAGWVRHIDNEEQRPRSPRARAVLMEGLTRCPDSEILQAIAEEFGLGESMG